VAHRRAIGWHLQAVLGGGQVLERLGERTAAADMYRESLADPRLAALPESAQLRTRLARLVDRTGGGR
jgi:hypothetical protein